MELLEKEIEDMVFNASAQDVLSRGLHVYDHDKVYRQVNLGAFGVADLIGVKVRNNEPENRFLVTIYELKKDCVGVAALGQACRYMSGIEKFISEKIPSLEDRVDFRIVLIGDKVELGTDFVYLANHIECRVLLYTYSFDFTGMHFDYHNPAHFGPTSFNGKFGDLDTIDFRSFYKEASRNLKSVSDDSPF